MNQVTCECGHKFDPSDAVPTYQHYLMIGDSRDPQAVANLMQGEKFGMAFTDPPYGIKYDTTSGGRNAGIRWKDVRNDDLDEAALEDFCRDFIANLHRYGNPDWAAYICFANTTLHVLRQAIVSLGIRLNNVPIIWVKQKFTLNWDRYHPQHETIYHCGPGSNAKGRWFGENNESTVWNITPDNAREYVHPCLSPESLIMGDTGLRPIGEFEYGDSVLGHDGRFHVVEDVSRHAYQEPIYRLAVEGTNLTVDATHNHPFLVARPEYRGTSITDWTKGFLETDKVLVGDYILTPQLVAGEGSKLSPELCFLMGLYLAEGHMQRAGHGKNLYPVFSLHQDETDLIGRIRNAYPEQTKVYASKLSKGVTVMVFDPEFGEYLTNECGRGSALKHVPTGIWEWTADQQKELLAGYLAGDGGAVRDYMVAKTVSPYLAAQMQLLAEGAGYKTNLYRYEGISGGTVAGKVIKTARPYYQLVLQPTDKQLKRQMTASHLVEWNGHNYFAKRIKSIEKLDYDGDVVNLTVTDCHTFQTAIGMSHNTQKPVELSERAIKNSSQAGEIVLDLFGGSGATLVAAHQNHRLGRIMELDPGYAAVILERLQPIVKTVEQVDVKDYPVPEGPERWESFSFRLAQAQAKSVYTALRVISKQLGGKNSEARALEMMAVDFLAGDQNIEGLIDKDVLIEETEYDK